MGRRLLTTEQAARVSGAKPATIRAWASRGHLRNYGDGYRARWDMHELDAHKNATPTRARPPQIVRVA